MLTATDIVELVRRKASQFEIAARAKGVSIHVDVPDGRREVDVDPARIEQVMANLMTNAIRHTPSGGRITVSLRTDASSGHGAGRREIVVSVADTGEGIDAGHLPHVFERFYRVQTSRSRSEGGAGLGLAIVKRMVEAHGGRVWVESQPAKGSTFYFTVPG
jgi:two-component system OmpR family sensor kinase